MVNRFTHRRLIRGAILALVIVGGFFIVWGLKAFPPTEQSFYPRCQFHSLTGLHCPGCGMTRSLHNALNGRFEQAIAYNALTLIVVPVLVVALFRSLWSWLWELPIKPSRRTPKWIPIAIGVVLVLFGILRNVPIEPFSRLAPHETINDP